jgi:hypothetical protein
VNVEKRSDYRVGESFLYQLAWLTYSHPSVFVPSVPFAPSNCYGQHRGRPSAARAGPNERGNKSDESNEH